jgi:hypothetical protein
VNRVPSANCRDAMMWHDRPNESLNAPRAARRYCRDAVRRALEMQRAKAPRPPKE